MIYVGCEDCIYYDECSPEFSTDVNLMCFTDGDFWDIEDVEFAGEVYWAEMSWNKWIDGWLNYGVDSDWDSFLKYG